MKIKVEIAGKPFRLKQPGTSIAIGLDFDGPQPNTYGVPKAHAQTYEQDGWVGDTRQGGGCNFASYTFTPHCNGTHTEGAGHITKARLSVHELIRDVLVPATLISVKPVLGEDTADSYEPPLLPKDHVIEKAALAAILEATHPEFRKALVLRTLPNRPEKLGQDYMQQPPAFFSLEAMAFLREIGVKHLLVDMPSVDRLFDEGKLNNHHRFWNLRQGEDQIPGPEDLGKSITEMIFVPDQLPDGHYLLNLQRAAFLSDCAPANPVLFTLIENAQHES